MRPDTCTWTEAKQNSLVRSCGVGRGFCWCSVERACSTGTEASFTEKGSTTRLQGCETWCKQVRQPVWALCCSPQVALCLWWGAVEEMAPASSSVPGEKCLCMLSLREACQEERIISPLFVPGVFQTAVSTVCLWVVCLTSLQEQCSALWAVSQPRRLTFKTQALGTWCGQGPVLVFGGSVSPRQKFLSC